MIHDVDESLRALVKRDALNGSKVEIAFDAPTKDWVARRNAPTIDMYLYDIREDVTRRDTAWYEVRDDKGIVTERRLPPRRFRLSYLVTAWTNRPEDEHRLLSALLSCFIRHEYVPPEVLAGTLQGQRLPVLLNVALPVPNDRSIADVWSAMGGELKPSLDVVVTAPLDIERSLEVGPPVKEEPFLSVARMEPEEAAGRTRRGSGSVVRRFERTRPTALADIAGRAGADGAGSAEGAGGADGTTGADGATGSDGAGGAGGAAGGRGKGRRGAAGGADIVAATGSGAAGADGTAGKGGAAGEGVLPDETFYASAPGKPGRRIRVRELPRPRPRK